MNFKDRDFLPGWFDSYQIWYKNSENSFWNHYMNMGFDTEAEAEREKQLIQKDKHVYKTEIRKSKVRRLRTPYYPFND